MRVTSASPNGNKKIDGPVGTMFEQYLRQSDVRGSKSINRCPKLSFVASSHDFFVLHKRTTLFVRAHSIETAVYNFEHILFFCYFNEPRNENFMTIMNITTFWSDTSWKNWEN